MLQSQTSWLTPGSLVQKGIVIATLNDHLHFDEVCPWLMQVLRTIQSDCK